MNVATYRFRVARADGRPAGRQPQPPRRVLVVDDDPAFRALLAHALRSDGAEVVVATGGLDLLEWAELASWSPKAGIFDVIVADVQMPDMTALDVLRRVPSIGRRTPVILVTAHRDAVTSVRAYDLGADTLLEKSKDLNDIRAIVRAVAKRWSGSAADRHVRRLTPACS